MIPNVIHFMRFSPDSPGNVERRPFLLAHYLAVKSAAVVNRPEVINFYYDHEPSGEWWEKAKPYLNLIKIAPPGEVFGVPLYHPAQQVDVLSLQVLIEQGGIYLDMDVICVKPFTPLLEYSFVLGQEGRENRVEALCNGVMLSEKGAFFARKWMEGFNPRTSLWRGFRSKGLDEYWAEIGCKYPDYLSKLLPEHIHVLDCKKFHWPCWMPDHLEWLFRRQGDSFEESYCHHLWETLTWDNYLKDLTVDSIQNVDTNFNCIARRFL